MTILPTDRPVEVTPAMIEVGVEALEAGHALTYSGLVRSVYLAMAAEYKSNPCEESSPHSLKAAGPA
jgi:hypothetical protein